MPRELQAIADRIRELRESCDYTPETLANELGISTETYLGYENNGEDIPISVLYDIAHKFSVDFSELLTGNTARIDTYCVVKKGEGAEIDRCPGYRFKNLAHRYVGKKMEPLIVEVEPKDGEPTLITHTGQEFNYVLEGSIELIFDQKRIVLEEGDSVYFNPLLPHGQRAAGDRKAVFLTVIID